MVFLCSGRAIQFCWPFRPSGKADSKVSPLEASLPCCEMWNAVLSATEVGGALDEVSDEIYEILCSNNKSTLTFPLCCSIQTILWQNVWILRFYYILIDLIVEVLACLNLFWLSFVRFVHKNTLERLRDMASSVKCLPLTHEGMSLILRTYLKGHSSTVS